MTPIVLILAYHFPPENAIGAARPFRFYKYLGRLGYECHVITAADVSSRPDVNVIHVPDPFLLNPRGGRGWQFELFARKFLLPGVNGARWSVVAARAASAFIRSYARRGIVLFSTYPPLGTHLAAWWLAHHHRLPWIADFRDPLAHNPGSGDINGFNAALYSSFERLFVSSADRVIANTDMARAMLQSSYPKHAKKVHLIWNGFDPEQRLNALPIPQRPCRVFSHIGELYEGRTISPLLESIDRLIRSGRLDPAKVQFHLLGTARSSSLPPPAFLAAAEAQGWLTLFGKQVPQEEAQHLMRTSDGLLLVQPHSCVQVPGKLFEYLQIGRPILAYVPPSSSIELILSHSSVPYRCAFSSSGAEAFDQSVFEFLQLPSEPNPPSAWFETQFNARTHAETLAELINGSCRRSTLPFASAAARAKNASCTR